MESILAELPAWARALFYVVLAVGGGVMFIHSKNRPTSSQQPQNAMAAVVGTRVEIESVKALTGEITGQAIAVTNQAVATRELIVAVKEQTEAIEEAGRSLLKLAKEVEEHRHEMGRRR